MPAASIPIKSARFDSLKGLNPIKARIAITLACFLLFAPVSLAKPSQAAINKQLAVLSPYNIQIQKQFSANAALVSQILKKLHAKGLPESLALVPMLESSFNPNAVSPASASGLWQLMPATAKRFGLEVSDIRDERFDPQASTDAAIAYLTFLYTKFDGDLSLTLAAYNAGEGRVANAIQQAGKAQFSALRLPSETTQYVSRFYALMNLVDLTALNPQRRFPLFANGADISASPLVNFAPLPPLVAL